MRRRRRKPELSIVVVAFDMRRELPRTVRSLTAPYQRDVEDERYEVVVVDNGSEDPLPRREVEGLAGNVRYHRIDDAPPSPARAANVGVELAEGDRVGVVLDGARMATPGVVRHALAALALGPRTIVATLAWHLGPDHQSRSVPVGYDAHAEDALLERVDWPRDGYRLFEIAALAGSNPDGWFGPLAESCCWFVHREVYREVSGYDERFDLPGGGLVNLDVFDRVCGLPDTRLVVLLGEGTFHQVHGGVSSNQPTDRWPEYHEQYMRIRGRPFAIPEVPVTYLGTVAPPPLRFIEHSARAAIERSRTRPR